MTIRVQCKQCKRELQISVQELGFQVELYVERCTCKDQDPTQIESLETQATEAHEKQIEAEAVLDCFRGEVANLIERYSPPEPPIKEVPSDGDT